MRGERGHLRAAARRIRVLGGGRADRQEPGRLERGFPTAAPDADLARCCAHRRGTRLRCPCPRRPGRAAKSRGRHWRRSAAAPRGRWPSALVRRSGLPAYSRRNGPFPGGASPGAGANPEHRNALLPLVRDETLRLPGFPELAEATEPGHSFRPLLPIGTRRSARRKGLPLARATSLSDLAEAAWLFSPGSGGALDELSSRPTCIAQRGGALRVPYFTALALIAQTDLLGLVPPEIVEHPDGAPAHPAHPCPTRASAPSN